MVILDSQKVVQICAGRLLRQNEVPFVLPLVLPFLGRWAFALSVLEAICCVRLIVEVGEFLFNLTRQRLILPLFVDQFCFLPVDLLIV